MKKEKRLHFYGEGGGSFTSMKREGEASSSMKKEEELGGAWLWSFVAFKKKRKGEELLKKISMARASLCSQKREKGLFI